MNEVARWLLNLPPQASTGAAPIDYLHYFVIGVTMLGAFTVFAFAFLFMVRFRRRNDRPTPRIIGSAMVEAVVIVSLLSLFIGVWVVGFRQFVNSRTPPAGAMEIYVTGKQWMWSFAYPHGPSSKGVLYVPVKTPVKLLITSRDVIHSFFVPAFRLKQDAVPGRYTHTWFEATQTGRFPIYCAEYCGAAHSQMLAEVVVLSQAAFEAWLALPDGPIAETSLAKQGELEVARAGCLSCHTLDATPHLGPTFSGLYGSTVQLQDGTSLVADEAYMTESMMDPQAKLVVGFAPIMPSYRGRLTPVEVAAILEFIKTLHPTDERALHPNPLPAATEQP